MIETLNGAIFEVGERHVVIECGGVGYFCKVTPYALGRILDDTLRRLPDSCALESGEQLIGYYTRLRIHQSISEHSHDLYGFAPTPNGQAERSLFRKLIKIKGIGCGTAHKMLSSVSSPAMFLEVAKAGDVKTLATLEGIGKKGAEQVARMFVERGTLETM